jgi:tRNA G10  N-methylase Trm11
VKAGLLKTVNRVYECILAKLELEALGAWDVRFDLDRLEFFFDLAGDGKEKLRRRLSWFDTVSGGETWISRVVRANQGILRGHADLWYSHFAYPFKARFRPSLARSLINIVNPEDEGRILDNFCGSGTTQVEAFLLGLDTVGVDINPFYTYMTLAKAEFFTRRLEEFEAGEIWSTIRDYPLNHYHPLIYVIYSFATQMHFKNPFGMFRRKLEHIREMQREWWRMRDRYSLGSIEVKTCSAEELPYPEGYFTGVVASPPYSNAIDYLKENRGAPEFFPVSPRLVEEYKPTKNLPLYKEMMTSAIRETVRVVEDGRKIAFVVGNQRRNGKTVAMVDWCVEQFRSSGCGLLHKIPQLISSSGTRNILTDYVLIFRKE